MTITLTIGNSDNKLSQQSWAQFVEDINDFLAEYNVKIHFFGGPPNWTPWQNCCWVAEIKVKNKEEFFSDLKFIREKYNQDSVAVIFGETEFI